LLGIEKKKWTFSTSITKFGIPNLTSEGSFSFSVIYILRDSFKILMYNSIYKTVISNNEKTEREAGVLAIVIWDLGLLCWCFLLFTTSPACNPYHILA
jgi:hypothetical protein